MKVEIYEGDNILDHAIHTVKASIICQTTSGSDIEIFAQRYVSYVKTPHLTKVLNYEHGAPPLMFLDLAERIAQDDVIEAGIILDTYLRAVKITDNESIEDAYNRRDIAKKTSALLVYRFVKTGDSDMGVIGYVWDTGHQKAVFDDMERVRINDDGVINCGGHLQPLIVLCETLIKTTQVEKQRFIHSLHQMVKSFLSLNRGMKDPGAVNKDAYGGRIAKA